MEDTFQQLLAAGRKPYLIPYGGSNPIGAAGYVYAMEELLHQRDQAPLQGELPNWIVVASSSGGTQAGLTLGAKLYQYSGAILGISVDEPADILKNRVAELASATASTLDYAIRITPEEILVNADYLGEGYGVMGAAEREAIRLFARAEGLLLDPVYTGRAAAGMIDLIRAGKFSRQDRVLFWHTGGAPALFANRYQNRLLDA